MVGFVVTVVNSVAIVWTLCVWIVFVIGMVACMSQHPPIASIRKWDEQAKFVITHSINTHTQTHQRCIRFAFFYRILSMLKIEWRKSETIIIIWAENMLEIKDLKILNWTWVEKLKYVNSIYCTEFNNYVIVFFSKYRSTFFYPKQFSIIIVIRSSVSHSGYGHNSRCGERIKLDLAEEMNVRKKKESPKVESDKTKTGLR